MGPSKLVALLAVAACIQMGVAKEFVLEWDVPSNGLILPSVSTAKCGDTIRFKCPAGATHGVYKMASLNGTCPESFDIPSAGVVLSAPATGCDFSLKLGDEPDFFITSQAPGACRENLKVYVHTVCVASSGIMASNALDMNSITAWGAGSLGGAGLSGLASSQSSSQAGGALYTALPQGMLDQNVEYDMEAGTVNAAAAVRLSVAGLAGALITAAAAALAL